MKPAAPDRSGVLAALSCYTAWGLLPLLFQAAGRAGATPFEIVGWRTLWAVPFALALVIGTGQGRRALSVLSVPRQVAPLLLSAALIGVNWTVYVWAVNHGRTLEGSLGYYSNPLLNMAAGAMLFGERLSPARWAAVGLAAAGVALQTAALGRVPWVSLILAGSFCAYGIVRKQAVADAQTGLLVECLVLSVPAALYLGSLGAAGHFGRGGAVTGWLVLVGPATVAPLYAFAVAARRLPLTFLAFLQFIGPTLQFVIGVEGGEAMGPLRAASFGFIWAGAAVFAWALWRGSRRAAVAAADAGGA